MRFIVSVLATVAIFLAATAASATVSFTVAGTNLTTLSTDLSLAQVGDQVQIDIFMSNDASVAGAGLTAFDLNGVLNFNGGETAAQWFSKKLNAFGGPVAGIGNTSGTSNGTDGSYSIELPRTLGGGDVQVDGAVRFFNGVTTSPAVGTGAFDLGPVGITGAGVNPHARLLFTVAGVGLIQIGVDGINGAVIDGVTGGFAPFNNASVQIGTVPEPGTALLMGLGLSGLSLAGRRRS